MYKILVYKKLKKKKSQPCTDYLSVDNYLNWIKKTSDMTEMIVNQIIDILNRWNALNG